MATMVAVEDLARKLTLWDTRRFRPIMTHDDLEPIMETAGFVPIPVSLTPTNGKVIWREYVYRGGVVTRPAGRQQAAMDTVVPRPRLPFPRLDGLHLYAYKAFFVAFGFYVGADRVADYFHVRCGLLGVLLLPFSFSILLGLRFCPLGLGFFHGGDWSWDRFRNQISRFSILW